MKIVRVGIVQLCSVYFALLPVATAFTGSSHGSPSRFSAQKSLVELSERRRSVRYYPDEREFGVIDRLGNFDNRRFSSRGPRYDDEVPRRTDYGVLGRDYTNGFGGYDISFEEMEDATRHLWFVVWATCWFYIWSGFDIVAHPPPTDKYFFKMDKETMQSFGGALAFLPIPLYGALSRLSKSVSLREAQVSVLFAALVAVPACTIISVFNPLHNRGWTALGFLETTMFLGVFIAHHLRLAAMREYVPPEQVERFERAEMVADAIDDYRPPPYYQSTQVAAKLTRDLLSFHVAISVITASLLQSKGVFWDLFPFNAELWPWVLVILHVGHNCMVTALFPGSQLSRFRTYLLADAALYGMHIYAALSSPTVQLWLSNPAGQTAKPHAVLGDQILVLWFVADAAMQLIGPMGRILQTIDFDERFGLFVPFAGPRGEVYGDGDESRRYLPPPR